MKKCMTNGKGFTLPEVMVVIAVIAILLGAFGTAMARWLPDYRFNSYALDLQGAIQNARLRAARETADVFIKLDTSNRRFSLFLDDTSDTANTNTLDSGDTTLLVSNAPDGVVFTSLFGSTGDATITFNSRGISNTSGDICLKNSNNKYKGVRLTLAGCSSIIRSSNGSDWE